MIGEIYKALLGLDVPGAAEPWPVGRLDSDDWQVLFGRCRDNRILGTLAAAVARNLLAVTDQQFAELARQHEAAMISAVAIERLLLDVGGQLDAARVRHVVLKGPAIAHLLYSNPSDRQFIDLDLLVDDIDRAVSALEGWGAERKSAQLRSGYDRRFGKAVTMAAPSGTELDVHRTLAPGPFGVLIEPAELFRHTRPLALGGVALQALDRDAQFVHACYHVALGSDTPRGSNLRDLALALADPQLAADAVLGLAGRWQGHAVLAKAIGRCVHDVPIGATPLTEWARAYEPSRRDRSLLKAYDADGSRFAAMSLATLRVLPARDRLRFAGALVLPSKVNLKTRSLNRRAHLGRVAGRLLRALPRHKAQQRH